jgi:hypothetical protein
VCSILMRGRLRMHFLKLRGERGKKGCAVSVFVDGCLCMMRGCYEHVHG